MGLEDLNWLDICKFSRKPELSSSPTVHPIRPTCLVFIFSIHAFHFYHKRIRPTQIRHSTESHRQFKWSCKICHQSKIEALKPGTFLNISWFSFSFLKQMDYREKYRTFTARLCTRVFAEGKLLFPLHTPIISISAMKISSFSSQLGQHGPISISIPTRSHCIAI